ncbi:MAG: substrate-binding domain-containing protein [Clostridiales bacterium]|jgi:phosphate transport system substrate-binding protein|nr:substrate-binding domain-containing protein [Clostridiales bacterium]
MMKRNFMFVLLLVLLMGLSACTGEIDAPPENEPPQNVGNFEFTPENYPKMGGSLAALPLGQAFTAAALAISREETADYIVFEGSTTDNYRSLIWGNFDILLAYEPSEEALSMAKEQGFEWEMTPIGRDALVFITNKDNPVPDLSDAQIRGIYSGEITGWGEVGGNDADIIAYQRNKDSGSQTLFDKLINLGENLIAPPTEQIIGSMIGLLEVVADFDNSLDALGYTVYYYLSNMEPDKLSRSKILAVDGVECNNDTIRSGSYPYVNDFYAVIPADLPDEAPARILYNWICSEQGKELAERENYVTR